MGRAPHHLGGAGEGGSADAFDTLMQVLAKPRRHFRLTDLHRAPRAPERLQEFPSWLREHGGAYCAENAI